MRLHFTPALLMHLFVVLALSTMPQEVSSLGGDDNKVAFAFGGRVTMQCLIQGDLSAGGVKSTNGKNRSFTCRNIVDPNGAANFLECDGRYSHKEDPSNTNPLTFVYDFGTTIDSVQYIVAIVSSEGVEISVSATDNSIDHKVVEVEGAVEGKDAPSGAMVSATLTVGDGIICRAKVQAAYKQKKAIDCAYEKWGDFGTCTKECGNGTKTRTRTIATQPAFGGKECTEDLTETVNCNEQPCGGCPNGPFAPNTELGPGSIAFTGFNSDGNDDLTFVVIDTIPVGTEIFFEDNEWSGSAFNSGEGEFKVTVSDKALTAGTVVTIKSISTGAFATVEKTAGSDGTVTVALGPTHANAGLASADEVVYAYIKKDANFVFLAAVANGGFSSTNGPLTNTGLVAGVTAIDLSVLDDDCDIAAYNYPRFSNDVRANVLTRINTPANWIAQDSTGDQSVDGTAPDTPFAITKFDFCDSA
eukprot:Opistho-2@28021